MNAIDAQEKDEKVEDILVVSELRDVFLAELPGLPPQREIDFDIELVPSAQPISRVPYHMA